MKKEHIFRIITSLLVTWALSRAFLLHMGNVLTLVLFAMTYVLDDSVSRLKSESEIYKNERYQIVCNILSAILSGIYCFGGFETIMTGLSSSLFRAGIGIVTAVGLFLLFNRILVLVMAGTGYLRKAFPVGASVVAPEMSAVAPSTQEKKKLPGLPLLTFVLCMIGYLPYYLYEFPGILTPDSINQIEQMLGVLPYSNHHPVAHTLTMQMVISPLYRMTGDITFAVGGFILFQMVLMALVSAYCIQTLSILGIHRNILIVNMLIFAFLPFNGIYAVTMWKDVLFGAVVVLYVNTLIREMGYFNAGAQNKKKSMVQAGMLNRILFVIAGFLMCMYRTNGWYAFILLLPFVLLYVWKKRHYFFLIQIGVLLVAGLVRGPVMEACQVQQADFVESLCIPIQQMANVLVMEEDIPTKDLELVHQVIDTTYISQLYAPDFADNMKELVRAGNPAYLESHKGEFLALWLRWGLKYPADYMNAYRNQTCGYWFPDSEGHVADTEGVVMNELGIVNRPLIGGTLVVKAREIWVKLGDMLPIYGILFSMGTCFCILLVGAGLGLAGKNYEKVLCVLPVLAVIGTLFIATPVANEFRYAYSLMYGFFFYMTVLIWYDTKNE